MLILDPGRGGGSATAGYPPITTSGQEPPFGEIMHDDFRIEIHIKVKFKGNRSYKKWSLAWWPAVPRVGDFIHLDLGGIVLVEQVKWEADKRRKPDYYHACAVLSCKAEGREPERSHLL